MNLLAPLGLLALIGIPILIIIYIIKPKYHKKNVSSTFVWKLSLKYRKRKNPFQWLQKSLLLFIQCLIIATSALLLCNPSILMPSKGGEKVVILDVSASMNSISDGNKTRLQKAIDDLNILVKDVDEENKLTIVLGSSNPSYLVRRESSPNYIEHVLSSISATYEECNFDEALKLANAVIEENPATNVFYYTDCEYEKTGYVEVKNFASDEWNVGILEFDPAFKKGYYSFKTKIGNYNKESNIKVVLEVDDERYEKNLILGKDKEYEIDFSDENIIDYSFAKMSLNNKDGTLIEDALNEDNIFNYQNLDNVKRNVQLVAYSNTFMKASLRAVGNINLSLPEREEEIAYEGQELYIFDGYVPTTLPKDGAVWIINPNKNIEGLSLNVGSKINANENESWALESNNSIDESNIIMNSITASSIKVTQYIDITNYDDYEVLMKCNDKPILLTGRHGRAKVTILALDLAYSTLPITLNMPILVNNVVKYMVKTVFNNSVYTVGDNMNLYAQPSAEQLYVNNELQMDEVNYQEKVNLTLTEPGIYDVKQNLSTGEERNDSFFVRISANETNYRYTREILAVDEYFSETGETITPGSSSFDFESIGIYFAAALLLLLIVEWGVQYREQY